MLDVLSDDQHRAAFECGSRVVSRGEVLAMTSRLAAGMRAAGFGPGKRVALALPLTPEAYAAHLAAHALGCTVAAFRPGWSQSQRDHAMRGLDTVITDLGELLAVPKPLKLRARPDDLARITYTSGSTGQPKGCTQTYRAFSLAYQPLHWPPVLGKLMTHFERCLIHESLASPVMMTYLGRCLVAGGTVVLDALSPEAIERHRITATLMPPARLHRLLLDMRERPKELRAVVLGGSPASPHLLKEATRRLGPVIWQGYGQAEAGIIAMLTPDDLANGIVASVGRPLPAVEVSVRDETGSPVRPGQTGEICVRSPHQMAGYWGEEQEQVLEDGWVHTRDLGFLGANDMLYLTGRARDVIMVNAEVCYAGAIERVLAGHPAVAQAYVVGAPDAVTGEAVHAFVVPVGRGGPDRAELTALVGSKLSAASVPKTVTIIDQVPVTAAGKPDRRAMQLRIEP